MNLALAITETAEAAPADGGFDFSQLLDLASLAVAVIVGIGSALSTAWMQSRRDERQRRLEAVRSLIDYERVLGEALVSTEAQEYGMTNVPFPHNLEELRVAAYPHYRFLKAGSKEDRALYFLLHNPTPDDSPFIGDHIRAWDASHKAAAEVITHLSGKVARRRADPVRTSQPANADD